MTERRRILIVEDDSGVREALAVFLESEGYAVAEAEHGEAALRRLRTATTFCLILLDLFMPTMNGWAFRAEQLRDPALARIPVVVLSADAAVADKAAQLGAAGHLGKPIDLDKLLHLVKAHC